MNKFLISFFCLLIISCNAKESFIDPLRPNFENISFDVVEKKLIIQTKIPNHVQNLVSQWFDQKVKIDGFDGDMKLIITDFKQDISSINNGKRVDIFLTFNLLITKTSISQTKFIEGNISSYGTLTGNFSLSEFDTVIQNTQSDLIIRLSKDLKSKI